MITNFNYNLSENVFLKEKFVKTECDFKYLIYLFN